MRYRIIEDPYIFEVYLENTAHEMKYIGQYYKDEYYTVEALLDSLRHRYKPVSEEPQQTIHEGTL